MTRTTVLSSFPMDTRIAAWAFHGPEVCSGRPCPIHAPTRHPLTDAPIAMPATADDLVLDRVCQHLVFHPDPDSVALAAILDPTHEGEHAVHACDGCCRP